MTDLVQFSSAGVHQKVLECLNQLQRGRVLDAPSGQGALSFELEKIGFKAFLGDIQKDNLLYRNGRCIQIDLNRALPFKARTFDYVVCLEGIEHLENPHLLICEFARVLKSDGCLIISTPNVMTIKSRWRYLFYSYLDYFRYFGPVPLSERHRIEEYDHQHINPLFYGEMKFLLEKYGFRIEKVETNRLVRKGGILFPFIKLLIRYKTKKKFPDDPIYISDTILEGENLILVAKREAGSLSG